MSWDELGSRDGRGEKRTGLRLKMNYNRNAMSLLWGVRRVDEVTEDPWGPRLGVCVWE